MTVARVQRIVTMAATAALAVLALTGAWLVRYYRPGATFSSGHRGPSTSVAAFVGMHRAATAVLIVSLAVLLGTRLVTSAKGAVWPAFAVVAAVGLVVTGRRMAWKVLALRAVTVNVDVAGMLFAAFNDRVRFVIVPGAGEMTQPAFRRMLGAHAVLLPVVVGILLWLTYRGRESPTAPAT